VKIDSQTVRELEIFQGSNSNLTILGLIDKTRTKDGRTRLQQKIINPKSSIKDILETQDSIKFFMEQTKEWSFPFTQSDFDWLQNYLNSTFNVFRPNDGLTGNIQSLVLSYRGSDFCDFAKKGVKITLEFLASAAELYRLLNKEDTPRKIQEELEFFFRLLEYSGLSKSLHDPASLKLEMREILIFDYMFRHDIKTTLLELLDRLAELDCLISMAKATQELGWIFPDFVESDQPFVELYDVYHPFVAKPVKNTISLGDSGRILFLTGPNMAGKTTFMKAVTISVILAHTGMAVPATKARLTPFSSFFCSLQAQDDVRAGISSFYSEIRRVKEVLSAINQGPGVFAVFDELFKGTNVKDALDCSSTVVNGITGLPGCIFLISSHLLELHDLVETPEAFCFRYFDAEIDNGRTRFDYCLRTGVNSKRLGYFILQQEGILDFLRHHQTFSG